MGLLLAGLGSAALLLGTEAVRPAPGLASGGGCRGANKAPGQLSEAEMRNATICLINRMRARHHLGSVDSNASLSRAASAHSSDMVHRDYFSHDSPGGGSIQTRIGGSGYLAGAHNYQYGEIIGGGTSSYGSPKAVMNAWMHSPTHRSEILNGGFHDAGAGVAHGFPGRGSHGATFTVDFGSRN
jgi:uncharacterized protein YkwD